MLSVENFGIAMPRSLSHSLRRPGLVSLHRRVYFFCPGLDSPFQVLDLLEAKTLQKPHRLGASHPRVAVNDYLVGGVQLVGSLRTLSAWNHSRPFDVAVRVFEWLSGVQQYRLRSAYSLV